jgi:hypothetical protein
MREGGRFDARNRITSPLGSISVVRAGNHQGMVVEACRLRERRELTAWGLWSPVCARGAGLAGESEYRAHRARYRWYVQGTIKGR